jgi:hypothetical protein
MVMFGCGSADPVFRYFSFDRKDVTELPIKSLGPKGESLPALISCTLTRTASPLLCKLPSTMWATPSCLAISGRFSGALL